MSTISANPNIDEVSYNIGAGAQNSRAARQTAERGADSVDRLEGPSIAEETEAWAIEPGDIAEELEGDREFEYEREDRHNDDFSAHDPLRDRQHKQKDQNRRRRRRIGKLKKLGAIGEEFDEEEVFAFIDYLGNLWRRFADFVEDLREDFDSWNEWFKPEKVKPPAPDPAKVTYVREEFNTKRSPHMWKTNPDRKWVLSFGNNPINNVVSSILYKYQNETISKDA